MFEIGDIVVPSPNMEMEQYRKFYVAPGNIRIISKISECDTPTDICPICRESNKQLVLVNGQNVIIDDHGDEWWCCECQWQLYNPPKQVPQIIAEHTERPKIVKERI